ncbi:MAG: hypothetical protein J0I84_07315, partial [Terrimonas sp.]|nr:hypothetical protein [Terrimonas sp.]
HVLQNYAAMHVYFRALECLLFSLQLPAPIVNSGYCKVHLDINPEINNLLTIALLFSSTPVT